MALQSMHMFLESLVVKIPLDPADVEIPAVMPGVGRWEIFDKFSGSRTADVLATVLWFLELRGIR
jgi:hypothetical protein